MARILVIDDEEIVCTAIKQTLESAGYEVDTSLSGQSGIEKVKNAHYDLVYLDIHMPGMGGLETFRELKKVRSSIKICILTAMTQEVMDEYLLLMREGAIDKIARKPVYRDMLLQITRELAGDSGATQRILVVDDDELIRDAFGSVLTSSEYELDMASSGEEAVRLFEPSKYQLVFLDLSLPDLDGKELLRTFITQDSTVKICVISGYLTKLEDLLGAHHDQPVHNIMYCIKPIGRQEILRITAEALTGNV